MTSANATALPRTREQEPSSFRLAGTLGVAGLLSGLLLVLAYETTLPIIESNREAALQAAVFEVVPGAVGLRAMVADGAGLRPADGGKAGSQPAVYAALDGDGGFIGYAIPAAGAGFQDAISLIFGYVPERRRIVGMRVLESRETPGLGDKIYKDRRFVGNFEDLAFEPRIEVVPNGQREAQHQIDAITGATISSKAVARIVGEAIAEWAPRCAGGER